MTFNLETLLRTSDEKIQGLVNKNKIRLVRHVMQHRKDEDWSGFDKLLKENNDLLRVFTAEQSTDIYKDAELILVFVATEGTRCLLRGAFWNHGKINRKDFLDTHPAMHIYEEIKKSKDFDLSKSDSLIYFKLTECIELSIFNNRLVIDWGKATTAWVQSKLDKDIWELRPKGYWSLFPGWEKVLLTHGELEKIITNPDGNPDWYQFLTEHDGVYVILDKLTGKCYVGAAYSNQEYNEGIWCRWRGYIKTGDNNNKGLVELTQLDPEHVNNFIYSLHYVCSKGGKSKDNVLAYEKLLKQKLGTLGAAGLNYN